MEKKELEKLRFPIGKYKRKFSFTPEEIAACIDRIEELPQKMRDAVTGLSESQLDTPYRPGGWTVRQVVHHVPDSHLNSYIRFRWTLTEDTPLIKAYEQAQWALLPDARTAPVSLSLDLLTSLHARWVVLLRALTEQDQQRGFIHPEHGREVKLDNMIGMYAWHGDHHLAQIVNLRVRRNWD